MKLVILGIIIFLENCFFTNVSLGGLGGSSSANVIASTVKEGNWSSKIAIIPIEGVITESEESRVSLIGSQTRPSMVDFVISSLDLAKRDKSVYAVILKIDSPGGTVTASEIIYQEIMKFKADTKIPVIAMFMSTAASGGYYVAMAADKIVAIPSNVTGSIGVIMQRFNVKGGLDKLGIKDESITSGENKTIGSPFVELKSDQEKILKRVVNNLYDQFVKVVTSNRKSVSSKISQVADGRIFSATDALKEDLIDQVGYFPDAIEMVKGQNNYHGSKNPSIVYYSYSKKDVISPYQVSSQHSTKISLEDIIQLKLQNKFLYLWMN
jgi:protease IV